MEACLTFLCRLPAWSAGTIKITHWGQATNICISKQTIIGAENGLSPCRCQSIIWTYAGILFVRPWGTNFSEIFIKIDVSSFKKMHLKMSSAKCGPFCLDLNVLSTTKLCTLSRDILLIIIWVNKSNEFTSNYNWTKIYKSKLQPTRKEQKGLFANS